MEITNFIRSSSDDDSILFTDEKNLHHSHLKLKSVQVNLVGFYYCVFNRSVQINDKDFDYEKEVIDYEASSIYVFINGMCSINRIFKIFLIKINLFRS